LRRDTDAIVRILITRQPVGTIGAISLDKYRVGRVYDVPAVVADYLALEDYGVLEMRSGERSQRSQRRDRRKAAGERR
jgi:hypothetical protein